MFGSAGAMVTMFYLAGYTKISGSFEATAKKDAGAYIAIVMIYLFAVSTAASWNAIPWLFWYVYFLVYLITNLSTAPRFSLLAFAPSVSSLPSAHNGSVNLSSSIRPPT